MKTMKNDAMKNTLVWLLLNDYHQSKEIFSLFLVYFNANCFDITTINELVLNTPTTRLNYCFFANNWEQDRWQNEDAKEKWKKVNRF